MEIKDTKFYRNVRPLTSFLIKVLFHPQVIGLENIPKEGRLLFAGNHTKWLDPVMLVGVQKRQIHFLAKEELWHGKAKFIAKGMGCIPVNRKIKDKNAMQGTIDFLNHDLCVGIFPEGTINRTEDVIMPFKIGAVKACLETNTPLVPFIITGKYKLFRKGVKVQFLEPIKVYGDLNKANEKLMKIVKKKLMEEGVTHGQIKETKNANL